ncbi:MAG: Gx transporter family protein [Coriobacteriia bacterium]
MRALTLSSAEAAAVASAGVAHRSSTRRVVFAGVLLALACVLGLAESTIGSPVPGVRLGLANIAVLVALYECGVGTALAVSVLRVAIVGLATGALMGPATGLAFAGAAAAWGAMALVKAAGSRFSIVGVSAAGAVAHVAAQFAAASLLVGSIGVARFATPALLVGLLLGLATGLVARYVLSRLEGLALLGR